MKRHVITLLAALGSTAPALAHTADHAGQSGFSLIAHMLSHPVHYGVPAALALGLGILSLTYTKQVRARVKAKRENTETLRWGQS